MSEHGARAVRPSEARARARVADLLAWSVGELGLSPSAARACSADQVDAARRAQDVASLPAAHEELLRRAGGSGPGSAVEEIFGSDLVGVDAMIGGSGVGPMRVVALKLVEALGYGLDEFDVVIRVRPGLEVDYVVTGSPDPPVWRFAAGVDDPVLVHPSFNDWLAQRILRAAKRRNPLRSIRVPPPASA